MVRNYYLDESGSSGDLARPGTRFNFGQQEIFVLACLGVDDGASLTAELARLKARHGIQAAELKSSSVRNKPAFVADLADYVRRADLPLMIEVVDKRFMISATIIETFVLPLVGEIDFSPQGRFIRNVFAEHLNAEGPATIFDALVEACGGPSKLAVRKTFEAVLTWLTDNMENEVSAGMWRFAADTFEDFLEAEREEGDGWRRFLPSPDTSKHGRPVWMLPNLSCFINIYARLNLIHGRNMKDVTLFHDEHAQFDDILKEAKKLVEETASGVAAGLPHADFEFKESSQLVFLQSHSDAGIQAADVLAGFVMRFVKDALYGANVIAPEVAAVFDNILRCSQRSKGRGANFVLPASSIVTLGVMPA